MRAFCTCSATVMNSSIAHAQLTPFSTFNLCAQGTDRATDNRLGQLQNGSYGDLWSQWANISICDEMNFPPAYCNYYGFTSNWSSDRAFFGLRYDNWNEANAMIAFGEIATSPQMENGSKPLNRLHELNEYALTKGKPEPVMHLISLLSNDHELHTKRLIIRQ